MKDFNIFCKNENEWIEIQIYLFNKGYKWSCDPYNEIYFPESDDIQYPMIISDYLDRIGYINMYNVNWKQYLNINNYTASQILRKKKLEKLKNVKRF